MKELSVFVDESGNRGFDSKYYLLTLVFHDQDEPLTPHIDGYEQTLAVSGLDNIPLHLNPLMRAGGDYAALPTETRLRLLNRFAAFAVKIPFTYRTFAYEKRAFANDESLFATMRRDLVYFLFEHLVYFQAFDKVKIYYDDGQGDVTKALHSGFEYALGKQAVVYRDGSPEDYRLQQVADYACGLELASLKYERSEQSKTEIIFFGTRREFLKNFLKKLRKHRLD